MSKIMTNKHYMGRDPFKDWAIVSAVTCLVSILLIVIGVLSYFSANAAISKEPQATVSNKLPFDENALSNALKVLEDRANNQKTIINANISLAPL
jgi:negative regulator of sigma E activity